MPVLSAIFEITFINIPNRGQLKNALPITFAVFERASILIAIGVGICPLAIFLIFLKGANINVSSELCLRAPSFCALTGFHVVNEIPNICVTVHVGIGACAILFIIFECADILAAIWPSFFTLTCLHIVLEASDIYGTVRIGVGALPV